jgi:uncharacterized protein with HEPN domain
MAAKPWVWHRAGLEVTSTPIAKFNLALVRLLEIVGEAASRMTPDDRTLYPDIPWPQIVGLRNSLIHGYDDVDLDILWQIITQDLPPLIATLENYLPPHMPGSP